MVQTMTETIYVLILMTSFFIYLAKTYPKNPYIQMLSLLGIVWYYSTVITYFTAEYTNGIVIPTMIMVILISINMFLLVESSPIFKKYRENRLMK